MGSYAIEKSVIRIAQRFAIFILGTGLFGNAVYIFGLSFYQGYLDGLGFDYEFFPIEWDDVLIWAYLGSAWLGFEILLALADYSRTILLLVIIFFMAFFFIAAKFFMYLDRPTFKIKRKSNISKERFTELKKIKRKRPIFYKVFYLFFLRMFFSKRSVYAYASSYFALIIIYLLIFFLVIWIFWPSFGDNYGQVVAEKERKRYEENLCFNKTGYWSKCIVVSANYIKTNDEEVKGRLIVRDKNLLGIYTKNGAVTVALPKNYYFNNSKNPCYQKKKGCKP